MTAATTGPRSVTPPRGLMRWLVNPVVRWTARSPAGVLTGAVLVLEFTGRRSGRQLSVPVLGRPCGGALYALTDAPWALNFTGGAPVTVTSRGLRRTGHGVLVEERGEAAAAIRTAIATSGARSLGLRLPPGWAGTDEELLSLRRAVRISLPDPSPAD